MGKMYDEVCNWENLRLAHRKAARGKRGRRAAATFEYNLADHLLELQHELVTRNYQPGPYYSFYIHDPKRRLISAALDKVRLYLRLAVRWEWLNEGQYHHVSQMVKEIGSLLGGWIKQTSGT